MSARVRRAVLAGLAAVAVAGPAAPRLVAQGGAHRDRPAVRVLAAGALPAEAAGLLLSGRDGGPLRLAAVARPRPERPGWLALWLEVDGERLLDGHAGALLQLEVYAYALGAGEAVAGALMQVLEIALAEHRLGADGVAFAGGLQVAAGADRLRILVRNRQTASFGVRTVALPAAPGGGPWLLPPLAPRAATAWLPAAMEPPAIDGGQPVAALPVTVAGRALPLRLLARALPAELPVHLTVTRDGGPGPRAPLPVTLADGPAAGWRQGVAQLDTAALQPGLYHLRLTAAAARSPATPLVVVAAGGEAATWAALGRPRPAARPAAPSAGEGRLAVAGDAVRDGVHAALRAWVAGDAAAAAARLTALEEAALDGDAMAVGTLVAAELKVLRPLAARDAESLLPVLDLVLDRYRARSAGGRFLLAGHARRLGTALLDLYRRRSDSPQRDALAADVSVQLAIARGGLDEGALRQAIALDADHPQALRLLAGLLERRGDHRAAAGHLERLVRAAPGDEESRLRLAINLDRSGDHQRAERLLGALGRGARTPWVASLAWQEQIRGALGGARLDDAERLLEPARRQRPEDRALILLQALVLDLRGRPAAARSLLEAALPTGAQPGEPSPRRRYSRPLAAAAEPPGDGWRARIEAARPALAAALAGAVP